MVQKVTQLPPRLLKGQPGKDGAPGKAGKPGKDGVTTTIVKTVADIEAIQKLDTTVLSLAERIEKQEKKLPEAPYTGGGSVSTKYTQITTSTYHIKKNSLIPGMNIFGQRYSGPSTVYLPGNADPEMIICIKDELAQAGTNNITIEVLNN